MKTIAVWLIFAAVLALLVYLFVKPADRSSSDYSIEWMKR